MKIDVTSRHFTPSDDLRDLVFKKVKKIPRFNSSIINCHIILIKESNL